VLPVVFVIKAATGSFNTPEARPSDALMAVFINVPKEVAEEVAEEVAKEVTEEAAWALETRKSSKEKAARILRNIEVICPPYPVSPASGCPL
jgi:bifunctional DNase/RNase